MGELGELGEGLHRLRGGEEGGGGGGGGGALLL